MDCRFVLHLLIFSRNQNQSCHFSNLNHIKLRIFKTVHASLTWHTQLQSAVMGFCMSFGINGKSDIVVVLILLLNAAVNFTSSINLRKSTM